MKLHAGAAVAGAVLIFAAGAASTWYWLHRTAPTAQSSAAAATAGSPPAAVPATAVTDIVRIAPDVLERAAIKTATVSRSRLASTLRVPGTVQANAYRKVTVTPLVSGRLTRVFVELGQTVARGAPVAEVYSPELAEIRARYIASVADLEAGEAKLKRTERLAALGSASQQELEAARAEHVRHDVEQREAAARLRLFGVDPSHVTHDAQDAAPSVVRVAAPQAGVIVERPAAAGMSAEPSTPLVTIAEVSPLWVIADVYERDLARAAVGMPATVTSEAYPGATWHGRVTYIAPQVRAETRTAEVRLEVPNTDGKLRFGMYVSVMLDAAAPVDALAVPAAAVQAIGSESVVFLPGANDDGAFHERRVTLGESHGDVVEVVSGLKEGDRVVTDGSFALRAEAERQGARALDAPAAATVRITAAGFEPNAIEVKPGVPLRLTFVRTTDDTCAKDVVLVDYGIRRELPLNTPVTVEFTPRKSFVFQCGMKMLSGTLTVR